MKSFIFQNENGLREKEEKGRIYIYGMNIKGGFRECD